MVHHHHIPTADAAPSPPASTPSKVVSSVPTPPSAIPPIDFDLAHPDYFGETQVFKRGEGVYGLEILDSIQDISKRVKVFCEFVKRPLISVSADTILEFPWPIVCMLCYNNDIPTCVEDPEEFDDIGDLILRLLDRHREEFLTSRISFVGDDHKSGGECLSLPCSGTTCPDSSSLVISAGATPAIFLTKPTELRSWHLEHGKQVQQGEGPLGFSSMGGKDCFIGADVDVASFSFKTDVLPPPPSYWIGLGRPPPAPDWQRFDNTVGRSRPPPKPNWRQDYIYLWLPPTHQLSGLHQIELGHLLPIQSYYEYELPPFPPISTLGSLHSIIPSFYRHVVSPGQTWPSLHSVHSRGCTGKSLPS
jgi:hypothetical protein